MDEIINKVSTSGLVSLDLEEYYQDGERVLFDIKPWLYEGLILREKEFRQNIKTHDWLQYKDKFVAIYSDGEAIVPVWAFMLISNMLSPVARFISYGNLENLESELYALSLSKIDLATFANQRVVIKGCSGKPVPVAAYVHATALLSKVAKSIMYGEPCSTVPIFKRK